MKNVHVLIGQTESGDTIGPWVWLEKPDEDTITAAFKAYWGEDYEAGTIASYKLIEVTPEDV
jgi:hypothetical protein